MKKDLLFLSLALVTFCVPAFAPPRGNWLYCYPDARRSFYCTNSVLIELCREDGGNCPSNTRATTTRGEWIEPYFGRIYYQMLCGEACIPQRAPIEELDERE